MAKDPAFLFYPGDWLGGTLGMSFEEKGAYIELLILQFNRGAFTEKTALLFLKDAELWSNIKIKFTESNGLFENKRLTEEKEKRKNYTESRRQSRLKSDEDNVRIYIVRNNVRMTYKIGSSVNPLRRYNELSNQANPSIMEDDQSNRDLTLIWYSEPVLRSEEKKLHNLFSDKNIVGEWFSLDASDLNQIYKKYEGTFIERTLERTENENENENVIKNEDEIEKKSPTKKIKNSDDEFPEYKDSMKAYFDFYKAKTGVNPSIKTQDGAALKKLILHFRGMTKEGQSVVEGLIYIFNHWQKLDDFTQKQIDISKIYTNINSIISQLKTPKKNANTNTGNTDYESTQFRDSMFAKIDKAFAGKQ